jgi:DNA-binding beta-propeller fold protein YncE
MSIGLSFAWAQEMFVPNRAGNAVDVYRRTANFNEAPRRTLLGTATALDHPKIVVVDTVNNELVVLNAGQPNAPSITVYERTASGGVAPIRTLAGSNTGLNAPLALAVDPVNNELFVLNFDNASMTASVTVHGRTASGNAVPIRTLAGAATALNPAPGLSFQALAVDTANNELLVANGSNNNSVTVYDRTASGNTAPIRALTGLDAPCGLAVDTINGELFVTDPLVELISVYPRTASGNTARIRSFSAAGAGPQPCGLSLDLVNNELFVTEPGQFPPHRVSIYSRTATGNAVPIRRLQVSDPGSASVPITTSPAPNAHTTVGLYRPNNNIFFLRNSNTYGIGEVMVSVGFAAPGDLPVTGDWDGTAPPPSGSFARAPTLSCCGTATTTLPVLRISVSPLAQPATCP